MEVKKHSKFQRYVMPGLIFQSVVIAGGYGTGAELNEYFFRYGPLGGLLAMALLTGFLAYILYTKGLEGMPSSRASILASVEPVTSAVIGTIVFHEPLSLAAVCGIVLVLGGIAVLSVRLPGKKREKTGQI